MTFASAGMSEQRVGILKPQICETRRYIMAKLQRNQEIFEIVDSRYFDPLDLRWCEMLRPIVRATKFALFAWMKSAHICPRSRILIVIVIKSPFLSHSPSKVRSVSALVLMNGSLLHHSNKLERRKYSLFSWMFVTRARPMLFCKCATFWNFGQKIATKSLVSLKQDEIFQKFNDSYALLCPF